MLFRILEIQWHLELVSFSFVLKTDLLGIDYQKRVLSYIAAIFIIIKTKDTFYSAYLYRLVMY